MQRVERLELFVRQVGNVDRISTAVPMVRGRREQVLAERSAVSRALRPHRALHLVEHDALVNQIARRVVHLRELEAVTFLREILRGDLGEKRGVQVDV